MGGFVAVVLDDEKEDEVRLEKSGSERDDFIRLVSHEEDEQEEQDEQDMLDIPEVDAVVDAEDAVDGKVTTPALDEVRGSSIDLSVQTCIPFSV